MATVSPEIAAAQAEYAARPYVARIHTSHFSGSSRFHTAAEAVAYVFQSAAAVRKNIREWKARGDNCWIGFDAWRSYVEGPAFGGRVPARYVLLQDSFDNSNR